MFSIPKEIFGNNWKNIPNKTSGRLKIISVKNNETKYAQNFPKTKHNYGNIWNAMDIIQIASKYKCLHNGKTLNPHLRKRNEQQPNCNHINTKKPSFWLVFSSQPRKRHKDHFTKNYLLNKQWDQSLKYQGLQLHSDKYK